MMIATATAPVGVGAGLLNVLTLVLLATAVLIVGTREPRRAIALLATQSTALAGIALVVAVMSGTREIYLSVLATLAVKAVLVPLTLLRVLRSTGTRDDAAMYLG